MKLRPIEEAPKDEYQISLLLYGKTKFGTNGSWSEQPDFATGYWSYSLERWIVHPTGFCQIEIDPTHFAELPQEPKD